ncbi:isoamylase 1 [Quercus suber]|uniref:Isoamylase 1 n=1 Tax=Quercus suber TaxID=58331 RepID=A0AAW0LMG9_QUESU
MIGIKYYYYYSLKPKEKRSWSSSIEDRECEERKWWWWSRGEAETERFEVHRGSPTPFGATAHDGVVNFAIFYANAVSATLCLISLFDLHDMNKTGDVWHVFLKGDFKDMLYGYKFDGKFSPDEGLYYDSSRILLDPYAKELKVRCK